MRLLQVIALHPSFYNDPDDLISLFIVPVIAELVLDKKQDDHAGRQAQRKTKDVDGRKHFIPSEVAQGNLEIVAEHVQWI